MEYLREAASGRNVSYKFEQLSLPQYSAYMCTMSLSRLGQKCVLELGYAYSGKDFYGYALNPSTMDNLVLGQITQQSVYSSHLCYYPYKSEFSFLVFDSFFSLPAPIQEVGYSNDQSHPG